MSVKTTPVQAQDVEDAFLRLNTIVKETPLEKDHYLSLKYDCNVYLKREDLQWVRSFKLRGAYNAIAVLPEEKRNQGITCARCRVYSQIPQLTCGYLHACDNTKTKSQSSSIFRW